MPPKANKPAAPKKPTKPSAKSKTGNTACSQAASNWQLSIRGKEPLDPQTYATLAKCRAMTRTAKQADDRARMGYNLNEQGAAALKGRLQKRFDQGLITQKSRDERLKMLLQQRKAKQAAVAAKPVTQTVEKLTGTKAVAQRFENAENKFIEHAISHAGLTRPQAVTALNAMTKAKAVKIDPIIGQFSFTHGAFGDKAVIRRAAGIEPAKPTDKAASLVSSVRQKPGYQNSRTVLADNNKREVREKLISTFVSDSIAGRRVPSRILDDMRDLRNAWISRAGGNDARLPDHNARPTFYMRPPVDAKGSEKRSLEKKADNVRKFWRVGENSEGGMDTTPLLHVAQASAAAKKAGKKHKLFNQPAFTLKQSSSQGGTGAGRSTGVLFQTEGTALDKAAQAGQKAPLAGQGSLFRGAAIDNKTTRRLEFNEAKRQAYSGTLNLSRESLKRIKIGGMEVTTSERPGIYNVFHSVTGRQMGIIDTTLGKDHRISTESYGYSEKNAQNLKKISEEMRKIQLRSEIGTLASRQSMSGPSSYVFGRLAGKKPEDYRISYNPSTRKPTQPPKPAFSRQGQLAPGRGTEERKNQSEYMIALRSGNQERIAVAKTKISERDSDRIHHSYKQFRKFRDNTPRISVGREAGRNGYMPNQKKKIVYK